MARNDHSIETTSSSSLPGKDQVVSNDSVNSSMEPANLGLDMFRLEDDSSDSSSLSSTEPQVLIQRLRDSQRQLEDLKKTHQQEREQWQVERLQANGESSNEESGSKQNILERKQRTQAMRQAVHDLTLEQRLEEAREALKAAQQEKEAFRDLIGRQVQTTEVLQQELSIIKERVVVLETQLETVPALEQQLEEAREAMQAAQQEKENTQARLEGLENHHQELLEQQLMKAPNEDETSNKEEKRRADEERDVLRKELEDSISEYWSDQTRMGKEMGVLKNIISELEVEKGCLEDELHAEYSQRVSMEESLKRQSQEIERFQNTTNCTETESASECVEELSTEIEDLKETIEEQAKTTEMLERELDQSDVAVAPSEKNFADKKKKLNSIEEQEKLEGNQMIQRFSRQFGFSILSGNKGEPQDKKQLESLEGDEEENEEEHKNQKKKKIMTKFSRQFGFSIVGGNEDTQGKKELESLGEIEEQDDGDDNDDDEEEEEEEREEENKNQLQDPKTVDRHRMTVGRGPIVESPLQELQDDTPREKATAEYHVDTCQLLDSTLEHAVAHPESKEEQAMALADPEDRIFFLECMCDELIDARDDDNAIALEETEMLEGIIVRLNEEINELNSENHGLCEDIDIVLKGNKELQTANESLITERDLLINKGTKNVFRKLKDASSASSEKRELEEKVKTQQKVIGLLEKRLQVRLEKNEHNLAHLYGILFEERLKRHSLIDRVHFYFSAR